MVKPRQELLGSINLLDKDGYGEVSLSGSKLLNLYNIILNKQISSSDLNTIWVEDGETSKLKFTDSDGATITLGEQIPQSLSEVLSTGNSTGSNNILISSGQEILSSDTLNINAGDGYSIDLKINDVTVARVWSSDFQILSTATISGAVYNDGLVLSQQASTPDGTPDTGDVTIWQNTSGKIVYTDSSGNIRELGSSVNVISPSAIGSNTDNYSPTGFSSATHVRGSASSTYYISGFDSSVLVLQKTFINIGVSNITIKNDNAGSLAANRILIPGGVDIVMAQNDSITLFYDIDSTRWRVI